MIRKTIQSIHTIFALTALLFIISCDEDSNTISGNNGGKGKTVRVAFTVQTGKEKPVTYGTHDISEYRIHTLTVLRFRPKGNDFVLDERRDLTSLLTGQPGPDYRLEWETTAIDKGVYKFLFVANEPFKITTGTTLSTLETRLLEREQTSGTASSLLAKEGIPMTGFARQGSSDLIALTNATQAEVLLERVLCRIDVRNRVPSLVISGLQMINVPTHSYVLHQKNADFTLAPGGMTNSPVLPNSPLPLPFDNGKDLPKAFYSFENAMPTAEEAPHVEVTATLNKIPVFYSIPFAKEGKGIPMKRNRRYILQLGDGSVVVRPDNWKEIIININFYLISIKQAQTDGTLSYSGGHGGTYTLPLDAAVHSSQRFRLQTIFTEHTHYLLETTTGSSWLTASISGDILTVDVAGNTTGASREGLIKFWSDAYAPPQYINGVYTLKIVQGN